MAGLEQEPPSHEALHELHRSWCRACVAGRGRADAHRVRESRSLPVIGIDFSYLVPRAPAAGQAAAANGAAIRWEEHEVPTIMEGLATAGRNGGDWALCRRQEGAYQYDREFLQEKLKNVSEQKSAN